MVSRAARWIMSRNLPQPERSSEQQEAESAKQDQNPAGSEESHCPVLLASERQTLGPGPSVVRELSRNNGVRDLVARELRRLGLGVDVEPVVGQGRADLLVRFGDGRPNVFLDVTVRRGSGIVQADERAALEEKDALYGPVCRAAGAEFRVLFVSPLGVVGPESRRWLDGVLGSGLRGSKRFRNTFYRSLSVGLQRVLGLCYLSLLPRVE